MIFVLGLQSFNEDIWIMKIRRFELKRTK